MTRSSVDITIPVLNEEHTIVNSLTTLSSYLDTQSSYDWSITVADNGSTDRTFEFAGAFAAASPRTRVLRLEERGRGRALKHAWSTSTADVVAYMDVDLSTGLDSLGPLIDPILEGHCEVSVGSRLLPEAEIVRSIKREVLSRTYNVIVRSFLHYGVADAQCGFKAIRTSLARELIPRVEDNGWFFDTELLALAHRSGLRINQVPVQWVEDPDSRVRIVQTAVDDLKGVWRLWLDGKRGDLARNGGRQSSLGTLTPEVSSGKTRGDDFDAYTTDYQSALDRSAAFSGKESALPLA